jgi:hypothetical protein
MFSSHEKKNVRVHNPASRNKKKKEKLREKNMSGNAQPTRSKTKEAYVLSGMFWLQSDANMSLTSEPRRSRHDHMPADPIAAQCRWLVCESVTVTRRSTQRQLRSCERGSGQRRATQAWCFELVRGE